MTPEEREARIKELEALARPYLDEIALLEDGIAADAAYQIASTYWKNTDFEAVFFGQDRMGILRSLGVVSHNMRLSGSAYHARAEYGKLESGRPMLVFREDDGVLSVEGETDQLIQFAREAGLHVTTARQEHAIALHKTKIKQLEREIAYITKNFPTQEKE